MNRASGGKQPARPPGSGFSARSARRPPEASSLRGSSIRGVSAANSNTRISPAALAGSAGAPVPVPAAAASANLGLNSERMRAAMVARLRAQGIQDERVLAAMQAVPRHGFVDQGLASRAYEDAALPIGHAQTISQPWIVARMLAIVCERALPARVLEVGAGCGYQAAVLAQLATEVYAVERIGALYQLARQHLQALHVRNVRLSHGDGMVGVPSGAPFDAIVVAAAGLQIPQALLAQLALNGRLIAPLSQAGSSAQQKLVLVERTGAAHWQRRELEAVRFVPLKPGIQS